ncbi:UDP-N-acetylmuramoyl-L-alanyl-D-glutamate--2,6-diaminopimelate ligase [Thermodesulfobacteriota bacterium]
MENQLTANRSLTQLLRGIDWTSQTRFRGIPVSSLTDDSRKTGPGVLFIAVKGENVDGHDFVKQAIINGCVAVVVQKGYRKIPIPQACPVIEVEDTRAALGCMAAEFFGQPARQVKLIGITGTNGKTTTSYLIESLIRAKGEKPGVIGTVNNRYGGREIPTNLTTPDPVTLQALIRNMVDDGITHVIMEVSSHALAQKRIAGLEFDVTLFTNLSRDHLDYHGDMESYFHSKSRLFLEYRKKNGWSVICLNDEGNAGDPEQTSDWGRRLIGMLSHETTGNHKNWKRRRILSYGLAKGDIHLNEMDRDLSGFHARIVTPAGKIQLNSSLIGTYNVKNILGALTVGLALGYSLDSIRKGLAGDHAIPGRLERIVTRTGIEVFVDYAHTPDALENVLKTLRALNPERLIVVFGCGGDRDRGKRPMMGKIAHQWADVVLVTDDNPRNESPKRIFSEIETGLQEVNGRRMRGEILLKGNIKGYDIIPSRRVVIDMVMHYARSGDVIVISGKGHENYQITKRGREFFDDRQEVRRQAMVIH